MSEENKIIGPRILAYNPGHNGSAAYIVNGEIQYYIEEERLSRQKYDGHPILSMEKALQEGVDIIIQGGTGPAAGPVGFFGEDHMQSYFRKKAPNAQLLDLSGKHHLGHAAAGFFGSGWDKAISIVVDGAGSGQVLDDEQTGVRTIAYEVESAFVADINEDNILNQIYSALGGNIGDVDVRHTVEYGGDFEKGKITDTPGIVKTYEAISDQLGFGYIEAGKTMGLAPYGKKNSDIPNFFNKDGIADKNLFLPKYPGGALYLGNLGDHGKTDWHHDSSLVTDYQKDLAWRVQEDTQEQLGNLIEAMINKTDIKKVCISGGYGLNVVANYYLLERFPDVEFYIDPISHDGGTAIGLAKLLWHWETKDKTLKPLTTAYLGGLATEFEYKEQLEHIQNGGAEVTDVTPTEVAQLIADRNIVSIFHGRSEAGPRALGNRSILYDPTDPNGKDHVNTVKGREWFRPFAASMQQEYFEEWFETRGLKESPYMMYAMNFKLEKHGEVPAVTHVDGTCRIQTVTAEQNEVYYNLIEEFRKITGIPMLFNTSFNLGGQPLVETIYDAMNTLASSDIEYLYLPEVGKMIRLKENLRKKFEEEQKKLQAEADENQQEVNNNN